MYQSFVFQVWLLIQLPSPVKSTICHQTRQLFALVAKGLGASADNCRKHKLGDQFPLSLLTPYPLMPLFS